MDKILPPTIQERLKKIGIRHFDDLIHDQDKDWLIQKFSQSATDYPVNVTAMIRNIIWQTRERVQKKDLPPVHELVRTYWLTPSPIHAVIHGLPGQAGQ